MMLFESTDDLQRQGLFTPLSMELYKKALIIERALYIETLLLKSNLTEDEKTTIRTTLSLTLGPAAMARLLPYPLILLILTVLQEKRSPRNISNRFLISITNTS
jgi:hypothetical protein